MKNPDVFLQQKGLAALGFDPGPLDGDPGPKTTAARAAWEASLVPGAPGSNNVAAAIVYFATRDLDIRETDGNNRGPGIEKYWSSTSYPDGYKNREPYCAAAVCYWIRQACIKAIPGKLAFLMPTSARAVDFEAWGKRNTGKGVQMIDKAADLQPGDIVVFQFGAQNHVGIVEARSPRGRVDFQTIEANTSPSSSNNEGGGVYRRTRSRNLIRAVVRITA